MMRRSRCVTGFVLATVLVLASLAGCGSGDKGKAENAAQPPAVAPAPPPPPPPPDTEEAPIRVKNGASIDVELVSSDAEWGPPSGGEWDQKDRSKTKDDLDIRITQNGGTCTSQTATDRRVRFVYNDPRTVTVELKSVGRKTKVTSHPANQLERDTAQRLKYAGPADPDPDRYFIKHILIGNSSNPVCTFTAKSQLTEVIVRDPN